MFKLNESYRKGIQITKSYDAKIYLQEFKDLDRESFVCLHLNSRNKVINREVVGIGTIDSCNVHPREIFKGAIINSAAAIIIVHNHPSGDVSPSDEDITVTRKLIEAGGIIGIKLIDSLIISGDNMFSMNDNNMI